MLCAFIFSMVQIELCVNNKYASTPLMQVTLVTEGEISRGATWQACCKVRQNSFQYKIDITSIVYM